ncbi:MAG: hypothetical protein JWO94_2248 [Verrucomicrobiaceae bacterium]|nr:hypothetical protein [Verrucomicrobiaceae bacterium]
MIFFRPFAVFLVLLGTSSCRKETAVSPPTPEPASIPKAATPVTDASKSRRHNLEQRRRGEQTGGIEFHRGKYLQQTPGNDGLSPSRAFGSLPEDSKAELDKLVSKARESLTKDQALQLIDKAREFNSREVFPLIEVLLHHPDPEVRGNALSILEGIQDETALCVVSLALKDADPEVRLQAVEAAGRIVAPETAPVLKAAFKDADLSVRQLAFQTALHQSDSTKNSLIEEAVRSPFEDLAQAGIGMVEAQPAQGTIALMMDALSNPNPGVREKAHDTLYLFFHEDFPGAAVAKGWWVQNYRRYDENLVLKTP